MQPQQPYYPPPSSPVPENTGQYDFIVNNGATPRGPSQKTVIMIVAGGAVLVIGLVWIILALAFGGGGSNAAPLVVIAQEQNEMVRITKVSSQVNRLSSQDARNFSKSTQMTIGSDQNQLLDYLAKNGSKLNAKQLAVKGSATTDSALDAAATSGTYDSTLTGILQTQLKAYQASLVQANKSATSASEKAMLKSQFDNATLLLEQSNQKN